MATTKLGEPGHYSYQQVCQAAWVVYVHDDGKVNLHDDGKVNLAGFSHTGDGIRREEVKVGPIDGDDAEFHIAAECPWSR